MPKKYIIDELTLIGIADAIRIQTGKTNKINAEKFEDAILRINNEDAPIFEENLLTFTQVYKTNLENNVLIFDNSVQKIIQSYNVEQNEDKLVFEIETHNLKQVYNIVEIEEGLWEVM